MGTAISLYLLVQHTRLKSGIQGGSSFCSFGKYADCDVVNSSQYAELLGVPLAALGGLYFFVLLVMGLIAPPGEAAFPRVQRWMARLNLFALVVDTGLFFVQAVSLRNFCLFCCLTYLMSALNLFSNFKLRGVPWKELFASSSDPAPKNPGVALGILGVLAFIAFLFVVPRFVESGSESYARVDDAIEVFRKNFKNLPQKRIDVKPGDGTFGNPAAKVKVVAFSDFECPFCKRGAFTIHTALSPMKDQVHFIFKHFPLDSTCNPALPYQMHPQACTLARLAYCAQKKGKFWEYHDKVFFSISEEDIREGPAKYLPQVKEILSDKEVTACLANPESLANISEDVKIGQSLGVRGTPSVYINGKHVSIPLTVESLRELVQLEASPSP